MSSVCVFCLWLCSRVTLSSQCMYWPCQRGYLFGELVTYLPAKREVPGSTWPAGAVSHCYSCTMQPGPKDLTTAGIPDLMEIWLMITNLDSIKSILLPCGCRMAKLPFVLVRMSHVASIETRSLCLLWPPSREGRVIT